MTMPTPNPRGTFDEDEHRLEMSLAYKRLLCPTWPFVPPTSDQPDPMDEADPMEGRPVMDLALMMILYGSRERFLPAPPPASASEEGN
jgi:hypothetical protein